MHASLSLLILPSLLWLGACSSTETELSAPEIAQTEKPRSGDLRQNNPFEWSNEDIQRDDGGNLIGGKRSQYDQKKISAYAKSRKTPGYLSREYHSQAWNGSKDYYAGSFQGQKSYREAGKKSWFGGKKSRADGKVSQANNQAYRTGSYRPGSAQETGQNARVQGSGYVESRRSVKRKPFLLIEQAEYRQLSVDQSRSLLGKGLSSE